MPKSKRDRPVRTKKKGKAHKEAIASSIKQALEDYSSVYVFTFENMRNQRFKEFREQMKSSSRFFLGANKVMQISLGRSAADEGKPVVHKLSKFLRGDSGLFFTKLGRDEVQRFFEGYEEHDFVRTGALATETSGSIGDMYQKPSRKPTNQEFDVENDELDIRKLMKDVEYIGSSSMSWKERKKLQNEKVVALGGKPTKKHRTPLSVAKPAMKNKKKREQREMEENLLLGRFIKRPKNNTAQKRRPEDRVLKTSIGNFSRGVLDVKDMLKPTPSKGHNGDFRTSREGKKKGKGNGRGKGKKGTRKGR